MNYYEELGVDQDATEQEIRKAHRRLVKLMHPDAQPDQNMKMLAETQMRRLNSIVSTLLDSEQRRQYNDQLQAAAQAPYRQTTFLPGWRGVPWWLASAVGAVVLTLAAVWLWADHLSNNLGRHTTTVYITPQAEIPPVAAPRPSRAPDTAESARSQIGSASYMPPAQTPAPVTTAVVPDPPMERPKVVAKVQVPTLQSPPAQAPAPAVQEPQKKVFNLPTGQVIARAMPLKKSQLPPPPGVSTSLGRDLALPPTTLPAAVPPPKLAVVTTSANLGPRDPLEGEWVYSPKEPERRKPGFYPPEYIDLKLFGAGDAGSLKGEYNAKYLVTDRPVSPEVTFELASISKGSRKFVWQSNNGAKGTFSIDPIDDRTIRIDWHTTSAVRGPALTSGTATLVRRQ